MRFPNAYIQFLIHFHGDRDYFECHEILEDYWKDTEPGNRNSIWVGFIQLAVAQYHYRRGNDIGAKKLLLKSMNILKQRKIELTKLGIDIDPFFVLLESLYTSYINGSAYKNINLPICDQYLLSICKKECVQSGLEWCSDDDHISNFIVHRHLYKDRADVETRRK
ncbi:MULTISPECIES: DUF309 domain-containing protein [Heyndrickxia]|uniref:DUF309 domain-containing protein n=1 Tax=Heyndrickxia TaxID=2837504 RepID=UPI0006EC1196|nr:DUF309 domain-containing protein [Heyndrickxia shackletonii]MBB2480949.1 DUF309 domain-containing protein [Bacillus sp. APMAM]NEZ00490.1 DUF309 domain-containing protein [Heyndrickxia shackletonii]